QDEKQRERVERRMQRRAEREVDDERERREHGGRLGGEPLLAVLVGHTARRDRGERGERGDGAQPEGETVGPHPERDPEHLEEERTSEGNRREERPAPLAREIEDADVEQEDVAEEADRAVGAAREKERRREPSDQPEERRDERAVAPREHAARRR